MRFCLLASGSKGNALVVEDGTTRLLIDVGLSAREIDRRLQSVGIDPDTLDALLITHEHADHVRGLGPFVRRHGLPVHLHHRTVDKLRDPGRSNAVREFDVGSQWGVGDLQVSAFSVTHDSVSPVGFVLQGRERKLGVATDLGIATNLVRASLANCDALVLESNHDERLLIDGPYPWPLKQRVKGSHGHLSNRAAGELLGDLLWSGLTTLCLAHISETNNRHELAAATAREVLGRQNLCAPRIILGQQGAPTSWVDL